MAEEADRPWVEAALRGALLSDEELAKGAEAWLQLEDPFGDDWEAILKAEKSAEVEKKLEAALKPMGLWVGSAGPKLCGPCS